MLKKIGYFGAASMLCLGVAACTSAQEQSVLNDIETFCETLPIGVALVVSVVSSIPAIAPGGTLIQDAGNTAAAVCSSIVADLEKIITNINSNGGTATVTVSSQSPAASTALKKLAAKYHGVVHKMGASTTLTFVVAPSTVPFGL
jgi:hypothetical protein